jgi:RimJ/RimL family protein N-acetyltransferase
MAGFTVQPFCPVIQLPPFLLETPRLRLRELDAGDAELVLRVLNTGGFLRHVGDRGVKDIEQASAYLTAGPRASYAQHGYGLWKVSLKASGEAVGICGLVRRDSLPGPDLGYAFLPGFENRGLATESSVAVLRHGVEVLGLQRILAIVSADNAASIRVLEKAGMQADGEIEIEGIPLRRYAFPL